MSGGTRRGKCVPTDLDLQRALARAAGVVENALESLLPEVEGAESRLVDAMRYATLGGGKRLRAFLVMETANLFSVSETCAARVATSSAVIIPILTAAPCRRRAISPVRRMRISSG